MINSCRKYQKTKNTLLIQALDANIQLRRSPLHIKIQKKNYLWR